ncbi:uncharacterized protein N7482_003024 [Penicillium canariense]|uniref:Uncharacterized protein n=1 Tax=Penicillium canariense TaxID=189055 RepID=A0A9W9IIV6_9EURO|nr:uncharacterized protein N7482_003024 [Penicillium canariense]KAJ5177147.1 hypothetical protein N7482_003024 [Penicillium canariense]
MAVTDALQAKSAPAAPKRLLLVSVPRTASNLLLKILNVHEQPKLSTNQKGGYFFYPAFLSATQGGTLAKKPSEWTKEDRQKFKGDFQRCLDELEDHSARAQKDNKAMFVKEHAFWFVNPASCHRMRTGDVVDSFTDLRVRIPESYGPTQSYTHSNETVLSDEYLRSWQFAFIIRHPALAWPSMYRSLQKLAAEGFMDEDGVKGSSMSNMSLRWTRLLYDWCITQPDVPTPPPVVDAHDLIRNPEIVRKFCDQTGLDKEYLQFEWGGKDDHKKSDIWADEAGDEQRERHWRAACIMMSTLETSKGIVKDKAPESLDIAVETAKWKVEFGEEIAGLIEQAVWDSMPDYEYLKARRLTV